MIPKKKLYRTVQGFQLTMSHLYNLKRLCDCEKNVFPLIFTLRLPSTQAHKILEMKGEKKRKAT